MKKTHLIDITVSIAAGLMATASVMIAVPATPRAM